MTASPLLPLLKRVKPVGPGRYAASCPTSAHRRGDRSRGLAITELSDGRTLIRCHMGCPTADVLEAIGVNWAALFPDPPLDPTAPAKPERRPFVPAQAFEAIRHEVMVAWIIATDMHDKKSVSAADFKRLGDVVQTLERIGERVYGS